MNKLKNILKIFIVTFFVGILLFQSTKDVIILTWFNLNQDTIIANHCVNIKSSETMCNAKCYLNKILSPEITNQKTPYFVSQQYNDITFFCEKNYHLELNEHTIHLLKNKTPYFEMLHSMNFLSKIDHPPQV